MYEKHHEEQRWARKQPLYALPKTHKKNLKIRPIVLAPGGVFDRVGWFLQQILKPLLAHVQSHLSSTPNLIDRLGELDQDLLQGKIPISFDVVSLYTNIDTKEAIHTVLDYVRSHKPRTYGLATHDLYELLDLMLNNNIFTYGGKFYRQIRGPAMGNRLSGTLAIICMDRFEHTHIYTTYQPYFYGRYVDDIGTFVNNVEEAELMLTDLNSKHATIAFELETPNEDKFLPILDLMIRVNKEGQVERKLYCKPASKGITLNFSSHQPSTTKRAMVNAELLRAETYPTSEFVQTAVNHTKSKLLNNGYPATWTSPARPRQNKKTRPDKESLFTLKIPFLSDGFNYKIREILEQNNIPARLVNPRGRTLLDLTKGKTTTHETCKSNICPAKEICWKSSVVYMATCTLCKDRYIGMTARRLHDRALEHLRAIKNGSSSSALGDHYAKKHEGKPASVTFSILKHVHNHDVLRLHIEEAIAIKKYCPELNRSQELIGTGFLP